MSDEQPTLAAGWYPTSDGARRYWDGDRWLDVSEPPDQAGDRGPQVTSDAAVHRARRRKRVLTVFVPVLIAALGLAVIGTSLWMRHSASVAADAAAAEEALREANAEAKADRDAERDALQEARERDSTVEQVEQSVGELAEEDARSGLLSGPPISVDCSPVAGGSVEEFTEQTTVLDCFVATEQDADGTLWGSHYHATVNWDDGSFTYGYGAP